MECPASEKNDRSHTQTHTVSWLSDVSQRGPLSLAVISHMMLNRGERPALRAQPYHFRLTLTDDTLDILNTGTCFNAPPFHLEIRWELPGPNTCSQVPESTPFSLQITTTNLKKPQLTTLSHFRPILFKTNSKTKLNVFVAVAQRLFMVPCANRMALGCTQTVDSDGSALHVQTWRLSWRFQSIPCHTPESPQPAVFVSPHTKLRHVSQSMRSFLSTLGLVEEAAGGLACLSQRRRLYLTFQVIHQFLCAPVMWNPPWRLVLNGRFRCTF